MEEVFGYGVLLLGLVAIIAIANYIIQHTPHQKH